MKKLAAIFCFLSLMVGKAYSEAEKVTGTELSDYMEIAGKTFEKLNAIQRKHGLPEFSGDMAKPNGNVRFDRYRQHEEVEVGWVDGPHIGFSFLRHTPQLIGISAYLISADLRAPTPENKRPNWSEKYVVDLATTYRKLLSGIDEKELDSAKAFFSSISQDDQGNRDWRWSVSWIRYVKGYPFYGDGAGVTLNEKTGITSATNNFRSKPDPVPDSILAEKSAKEKAVSAAKKIMEWEPLRREFMLHIIQGPYRSLLAYVNPNNITSHPSIEEAGHYRTTKARLAWVFIFNTFRQADSRKIEVWIDAESGEFLGGDFQ